MSAKLSHIKERTCAKGVGKQGVEENNGTYEDTTGRWRKRNNKELHNLCFSPNITRITKLGRMR
jgi:hypothetical protein